ncbi:MAG: hypothetical protein PHI15_02695 [Methanomicrobium sp.]|nr:hypothetical protein [Methanomicrobium sp.]
MALGKNLYDRLLIYKFKDKMKPDYPPKGLHPVCLISGRRIILNAEVDCASETS